MKQLKAFLAGEQTNVWLHNSHWRMYVRKGVLQLVEKGPLVACLVMVSVVVPKRGKGTFTRLLPKVERLAAKAGLAVYVENVRTKRFREFFVKQGYIEACKERCYFRLNWHIACVTPVSRLAKGTQVDANGVGVKPAANT